jgi:hypothetical protein
VSRPRTIAASILALLCVAGCLAGSPGVARADTDYRCLNVCLRGGKPGSKCLAQCTFTPFPASQGPLSPAQAALQPLSRHSQFLAPNPSNDIVIFGPEAGPPIGTPQQSLSPTTQPLGPSTNYKCVRDCEATGYQHGYCVAGCSY